MLRWREENHPNPYQNASSSAARRGLNGEHTGNHVSQRSINGAFLPATAERYARTEKR
jgi:hypothetical protein